MGYESVIDDDVEDENKTFISGEEITSEHIGKKSLLCYRRTS